MRFVLPLPLNLANSRVHWRKKHKLKKAYWAELDALQLVGRLPAPPKKPWDKVVIGHHWFVGNRMDPDNTFSRLKWPIDFLRTRGYLVEDREANVTLLSPVQTVDRKDPRVEIELEQQR